MTLRDRAILHTLELEGGYVDHPDDPGGETNFGISKRSYPHLDIRNLTREQAIQIYVRDYWDQIPADLPDGLRWMAFDSAVNHGVERALGWLSASPGLLSYTATRLRFYSRLMTFPTFGVGWVRRVASVLEEIRAWYDTLPPSRAETVVFNGFGDRPIILRDDFNWRVRGAKIDITRATPAEE